MKPISDARTCGDGCTYLREKMQCTAEADAVHCGSGCSALRLRWGKTGSPDKSGEGGKNGLSRLLFMRFLPDASGPYVASAPTLLTLKICF